MQQGYKDLIVWQKAMLLVKLVYELCDKLPNVETFRLVQQMIRAVISVPSNIAEGWSRNRPAEIVRFFEFSYSSSCELETQTLIAKMRYPEIEPEAENILNLITEIQKMLFALIKKNKSSL